MNIKLMYTLVPFGLYQGFPAITAMPDGADKTELTELITLTEQVAITHNINTKTLLIDSIDDDFLPEDIGTLLFYIDAMRKKGWMIMFLFNGNRFPSYAVTNGYKIAVIDGLEELDYEVNEYHLIPSGALPDGAEEPPIKAVYKYIHTGPNSRNDIIKFLMNVKTTWALAPFITKFLVEVS